MTQNPKKYDSSPGFYILSSAGVIISQLMLNLSCFPNSWFAINHRCDRCGQMVTAVAFDRKKHVFIRGRHVWMRADSMISSKSCNKELTNQLVHVPEVNH